MDADGKSIFVTNVVLLCPTLQVFVLLISDWNPLILAVFPLALQIQRYFEDN